MMEREGRKQTREAEPVADDTEDIAQIKRMLTKQNSMVVGANPFGCVNLALICCVLGLVDTRGGATKKTTNYAGDVTNNRAGDVVTNNITVTFDVDDAAFDDDDTSDAYSSSFLLGARGFGNNPCIDESGKATLRSDTGQGVGVGLGDLDCENSLVGAQSGTDVTKGATGMMDPSVGPIQDYNAAGMCTVNVHWHIGAEHRSEGEYDENQSFDHPNKDTYAGSHRRLASADGGMRIGHMCHKGKELWEGSHPSVRNTDGTVKEYDWKYCKDMHVGLTYEFHWPHSSLGACQTPWQYQYHFLDGVLCGATMGGVDINTAAALLGDKTHGIGVEGQVFTIVNGMGGEAIRPTWDVLNGWDRQAIEETKNDATGGVAYYQGSTTGDAANNDDVCRGTGNLVTWHQDRKCHTLEASTMDEMCRRMLVISADDMSPDVAPHGARETVTDALSDTPEDHPDYTRRLRGSN